MVTTFQSSLVRVCLHLPVRRLESMPKHTKLCILCSVQSDHVALTRRHEAKLKWLLLNVIFLRLAEFHLIPIRFSAKKQATCLWVIHDP
jgi:hypothetical protein